MTSRKVQETTDDLLSPSMQGLLEKLLKQELNRPSPEEQGVASSALTGRLDGFDAEGYPIVIFIHAGAEYRQTARSTIELTLNHLGHECLIQLCGGPDTPVISGLIQPPLTEIDMHESSSTIRSDERILLQCGDAYIELTAEGTVRIRGDYVESVSYGTNRLKGSSVKIN
ncbi:MAG: DUF6484 domain-containing protein [Candidatus Thiodiazotropha sp.]